MNYISIMAFHGNITVITHENHLTGLFSSPLLYLNVTFSGNPSMTILSKVFFPTAPTRKMIIASNTVSYSECYRSKIDFQVLKL